jgi:hypothetical protein
VRRRNKSRDYALANFVAAIERARRGLKYAVEPARNPRAQPSVAAAWNFGDNALSDIGEKQLASALWLWPRVTPVPAAEISSDTI